ncbi:MAG: FkbM family methyltransferase [Candidatus Dadabacteria bacterium]|nr:MAG: FkbM family methyltransferase [Candidatus Dadabacteria bacterium]
MEQGIAYELILKPGERVLDIGGYDGGSALSFAKLVGNSGEVHTFEPHPVHYLKLCVSVRDVPYITPHCIAMSNRKGTTLFYSDLDFSNPKTALASTIVADLANYDRLGEKIVAMKVETTSIDYFCKENFYIPDFIKVDVEGAENLVFEGSLEILEKIKPTFFFECSFLSTQRAQLAHLPQLIQYEYELYLVNIMYCWGKWTNDFLWNKNKLTRLSLSDIEAATNTSSPDITTNLLAVHKSKLKDCPIFNQCEISDYKTFYKELLKEKP